MFSHAPLCDPMGSSHGILQAGTLDRVAMLSSRGSSQPGIGNLCLLHWQALSLPLRYPGSPCNPPTPTPEKQAGDGRICQGWFRHPFEAKQVKLRSPVGGWPFGRTREPDPEEKVSLLLLGTNMAQLRSRRSPHTEGQRGPLRQR